MIERCSFGIGPRPFSDGALIFETRKDAILIFEHMVKRLSDQDIDRHGYCELILSPNDYIGSQILTIKWTPIHLK